MGLPPAQRHREYAAGLLNPQTTLPDEELIFQELLQKARTARLPEPGAWGYLPFVGPAWEAAYDLQEGDYAGAALNAGLLAAEVTPFAFARRSIGLLKGINAMKRGRLLASSNTQLNRVRKVVQRERDAVADAERFVVHHTYPMKGAAPTSKEARRLEGLWRNHPLNLKILPENIHNGVHHGFGNRFTDPFLKTWHGTNDFHKAAAAATGAVGADSWQNSTRSKEKPRPAGPELGKVTNAGQVSQGRSKAILDPERPIEVRRTEKGFIISNRR